MRKLSTDSDYSIIDEIKNIIYACNFFNSKLSRVLLLDKINQYEVDEDRCVNIFSCFIIKKLMLIELPLLKS